MAHGWIVLDQVQKCWLNMVAQMHEQCQGEIIAVDDLCVYLLASMSEQNSYILDPAMPLLN